MPVYLSIRFLRSCARVASFYKSYIMFKIIVLLSCLMYCESVYVYSSFWEPLFNPRVLNYRVDAKFDPDSGRNARELFEMKFGYRGEQLITDLGNGKGLKEVKDDQGHSDVRLYYTYPGANSNEV